MTSESKLEAHDECEALLAPIWRCVQPHLGGDLWGLQLL